MSSHDLNTTFDDFGETEISFEWDHAADKGLITECNAVRYVTAAGVVPPKRVLLPYAKWQVKELQDSLEDDMREKVRTDAEEFA